MFNLPQSQQTASLGQISSMLKESIERKKLDVETESGDVAGIRPRVWRGIPSNDFRLIKYFSVKETQPATADKFRVGQNRLCHTCCENYEFDHVLRLCKRNTAFLRSYGIPMKRVIDCVNFLKDKRKPILKRFKFFITYNST